MGDKHGECSLRVCEALGKDVGKAIVRLCRDDFLSIGIDVGDIVEVNGKATTAARALPYHENAEKGIVQMDGILRDNAGAGIGETVIIRASDAKAAAGITLSPAGSEESVYSSRDAGYISSFLDGIPVIKGNMIRVKLLGYSYSDYYVIDTKPGGTVIIKSSTEIKFDSESGTKKEVRVSYEDIGGLENQVQKIREMIELPLKYPEVFKRLGIEAPKGVLLYGPPGTGKTLIARAVANETDAFFIHVNGPEIIHKFYGESEAKLRNIFETAESNAPSIIFLDEIDAIAPKREDVTGEVEKRVVAQLLALMDGLKDRGQVIVIGATNIPNSLDTALRRPGRFDREIEIGVPDRNGRMKILQIHTRNMPLCSDVDIEKLAGLTHGFVGADLKSLCREAAMTALRRILPRIDFSNNNIPYDELFKLQVTMKDFSSSLNDIEPSAIREVFVDIPNITFDDVGGLEYIKEIVKKSIVWPQEYKEIYNLFGCRPPKGILFHGAPGTGKTLMAKAVAHLGSTNFISVKGPELLSKWVGESEKGIRDIFKMARRAAPCIIFFDEIDSIAPMRGRDAYSDVTERIICQMLTEMDGIEDMDEVLVIGVTNRLDMVDAALLRPGRFGMIVEFKLPDYGERIEIFKVHMRGKPVEDGIDFKRLSQMTDGFTGADIMEVCQKAALSGLSDYILSINSGHTETPVITLKHLLNAIESR